MQHDIILSISIIPYISKIAVENYYLNNKSYVQRNCLQPKSDTFLKKKKKWFDVTYTLKHYFQKKYRTSQQ